MRTPLLILTLVAAVATTPAMAGKRDYGAMPDNENNPFWRDYQTDLSEARRELDSDLRHATDEEDTRDAWSEYRQEVADARHDYAKEMREKGYRRVEVRVEE